VSEQNPKLRRSRARDALVPVPPSRSAAASPGQPARPLTSFTPEQRRVLLALIEAGRGTPSTRTPPRMSEDTEGWAAR